ncbi:hypothetical protein ACFL7D_00585 [candidate division KSB1 bacterium]
MLRYIPIPLLFSVFILSIFEPLNGQSANTNSQSDRQLVSLIGTIGGDDTSVPSEFILARPVIPVIKKNGDILIPDECKIKIFDASLKPKKIIGGLGQGPGEFEFNPTLRLSSRGFLTANENAMSTNYSLFDDNYKFMFEKKFQANQYLNSFLRNKGIEGIRLSPSVYMLNDHSMINSLSFNFRERQYDFITYEDENTFVPVLFFEREGQLSYENRTITAAFTTSKRFKILSDSIVVFIKNNSDDIKYNSKTEGTYTLHTYNFIDNYDKTNTYTFKPIHYTEERIKEYAKLYTRRKADKKLEDLIEKAFEKQKYHWPIRNIYTDQNYIFVFLESGALPLKLNVIDSITSEVVYNGESPFEIDNFALADIKNGNAYLMGRNNDGFMQYRVYKINPTVYGLPKDLE